MIRAEALVQKFQYARDNNWGYIWGTAGILWTEEKQKKIIRQMEVEYGPDWKDSSKAKADHYYQAALNGWKWIGRRVADCSGLFAWAFKELGGSIAHGSNSIWKSYCSEKGMLENGKRTDGKPLLPGTAVFTESAGDQHDHIGLYIGNGKVKLIEAQGTKSGVTTTEITNSKWKCWGELKGVNYQSEGQEDTEQPDQEKKPTIRKGDTGAWVEKAQEELIRAGYSCGAKGADGIFGNDTLQAVKQFQKDNGLNADGIIGPKTWAALDNRGSIQEHPPDAPAESRYTVTITGLTEEQAALLVRQWPGAEVKKA